ncbi:hypothetical protein PMAYCL1PPCAC_20846, partial [Pristionchus mayeri]
SSSRSVVPNLCSMNTSRRGRSKVCSRDRQKREMVVACDDDEPTSSKRAANGEEEEEAETGPSIAELQEMNRKLAENFQRICRVARENELRAERAEKQLESKQDLIDGSKKVMDLEKTVASLTKQLDDERTLAKGERERDGKTIDDLTFQVAKYAMGLQQPPPLQQQLSRQNLQLQQLQQVPSHQPNEMQQLHHQQKELQEEKEQEKKEEGEGEELQQLQLADLEPNEMPQLPPEMPLLHLMQPAELQLQLVAAAPSVCVQQPQPPPVTLQQLLQQNLDEAARAPAVELLHESGHPNNILQMCRPDQPYSMPISDAAVKLHRPFGRCGQGNFFKNCFVARGMKFDCEACGRTLNKYSFLGHFFTDAHAANVLAHGGAVSVAAVNYWVRVLAAVAAPKHKARAAAAAARTAAHAARAAATRPRRRSPADAAVRFRAAAALVGAGASPAAARQAAAYEKLAAASVAAAAEVKWVKKEEEME